MFGGNRLDIRHFSKHLAVLQPETPFAGACCSLGFEADSEIHPDGLTSPDGMESAPSHYRPYFPESLLDRVVAHVVKLQMSLEHNSVPQVLGIRGPLSNKQYHFVFNILDAMHIKPQVIFSNGPESLASGKERENFFINKYADTILDDGEERRGVMLVDIGDESEYSFGLDVSCAAVLDRIINRPYSMSVLAEIGTIPRLAVIVIANSFGECFDPLVQCGQMQILDWLPQANERLRIIEDMYAEDLTSHEISCLDKAFPSMPLEFFSDLRRIVIDEAIQDLIADFGADQLQDRLATSQRNTVPPVKLSFFALLQRGRDMAPSYTPNPNPLVTHPISTIELLERAVAAAERAATAAADSATATRGLTSSLIMGGGQAVKAKQRRRTSAFQVFAHAQRDDLRLTRPELSFGEASTLIGRMWRALEEAERRQWQEAAATAMADIAPNTALKPNPSTFLDTSAYTQLEHDLPPAGDPHRVFEDLSMHSDMVR